MAEVAFCLLPDDVVLKILTYVTTQDLLNLGLVNRQLERLSQDRSLVRRSDFENCYGASDRILTEYIRTSCTYIEYLNLNHCYWLNGKTIETVVPKCKSLKRLLLLDLTLTSKRLCKILAALPKLEAFAFTVSNIHEFDEELNKMEDAQRTMGNICDLTLHFKVGLTPRSEPAISVQFLQKKTSFFEHCRNLEGLHVIGHPNLGCGLPKLLVQPNVVKIENLKNIKELSLNYAIDPAARIFYYGTLLSVAKLQPQLKTVLNPSANFESQIRSAFWTKFWHSQFCLENLDLSNIALSKIIPNVFEPIKMKTTWKYLNISNTFASSNEIVNACLTSLATSCPNLTSLNVRSSQLVFKTGSQQLQVFDIEGFSSLVKMCRSLQHLNLSGFHIHSTDISTKLCKLLSEVSDMKSLSISPCCCATVSTENLSTDCLRSGRKRSPPSRSTSGVQKKRRIGVDTSERMEPIPSTSSADPQDSQSGSNSSELQELTAKWPNMRHFEMINAKLTHPVLHKGHNGLKPSSCNFTPCMQSYCVTDVDLSLIGRWKKLQSLHLAGLPGIQTGSCLLAIAKQCPELRQLHLAYLGLTGFCVYLNQLIQAFKHFTALQDFRLEHGHLSIGHMFCKGLASCRNLQRLCIVSENGSIEAPALFELMSSVPSLVVLQLFTGATKALCKKIQKNIKERYESERPALSVTIWPLFDQDAPFVINSIPTKHLEELTLFSSKICDRPPGWRW